MFAMASKQQMAPRRRHAGLQPHLAEATLLDVDRAAE
jgi:hypothetical protein